MRAVSGRARFRSGKISARVRTTNVLLLVLALALVTVTATIISRGVAVRASEDLALFYSADTVDAFNLYMSRDLALLQKVARTRALTDWFADEGDEGKKLAAYNEMIDYIDLMRGSMLYFVIDGSKHEYALDAATPYNEVAPLDRINPDDSYNDWYYDLVSIDAPFAYNIDIDKLSGEWQIWVNHEVVRDGKLLGVICSGLTIDDMLEAMFARYETGDVKGFVIDRTGSIVLGSDFGINDFDGERNIGSESKDPSFNSFIGEYLANSPEHFPTGKQPEIVTLSKGPYSYASIVPIAHSSWIVVTFFNSSSLFSASTLVPLVLAFIAIYLFYTLAASATTSRLVLSPLDKLTDSVSKTGDDEAGADIYGSGRADEIGDLARTISGAWERLQEARDRARLILDATPLGCTLIDAQYNCIDCNEEAIKLFRAKDKQDYLDRFFDFAPEYQPDGSLSSEMARVYIAEAFEKGRRDTGWTHMLSDGTIIPAEVTLVRLGYGGGYVVAGFTRDLREHQQMIKDIEQRDVLLNSVNHALTLLLQADVDEFENALLTSMGIMAEAVGADRVRLWENHYEDGKLYCTQLYEWSEGVEPSQGKDITIKAPYEEDLPGWEERLSRGECINSLVRDMSEKEQARLAPQGILSILIVPVFLRGEFWGFVGFNDCRKEHLYTANEESILRSASLLITNALLRNEMTQELGIALEEAKAASNAKGRFLSNMSHEIRTPINAIVGMTTIGKAAPNAEKKDYAFEKIEVASSHLLGVINDVLDMSKIEADKFELSNVEFEFERMLQKVVNVVVFRVNEKNQKLSVKLDPKVPPRLIGDDQRLAQVITNLLSNAVKFTPDGGAITLQIENAGEADGKCIVKVDVADNGVGISHEQLTRLFTSFEQAESSTSRKFGGTGLGLAISKQIVELMDGTITVESDIGKGSVFSFTVKMERAPDEPGELLPPNLKDLNVLVVDDEQDTLDYFMMLADRMGIACSAASDADTALKMLSSGVKYDICFTDWKMPGVDGIELTRRIRAAGEQEPVIIMISAYDWLAIEQEAKDAGVDDFLSKPLFPSDIADTINRHLGFISTIKQESAKAADKPVFPGRRILLAEDVEINREIVLALLEPTQIVIDCATNGLEAVKLFSDSPDVYDMIFMDIQMPEMDGLTATETIRALGTAKASRIPIIAMTANVFREDVEMCLAAGMNDHIGKPIDFNEMMEKLGRYIGS
ncbi:MAG: response regulator [Oscillospiraceae bacterium]|nr:response regulator [Oscillospiraceae bacterium]